jgi:hypothetical protein
VADLARICGDLATLVEKLLCEEKGRVGVDMEKRDDILFVKSGGHIIGQKTI